MGIKSNDILAFSATPVDGGMNISVTVGISNPATAMRLMSETLIAADEIDELKDRNRFLEGEDKHLTRTVRELEGNVAQLKRDREYDQSYGAQNAHALAETKKELKRVSTEFQMLLGLTETATVIKFNELTEQLVDVVCTLPSIGRNKIQFIKGVRTATGWGLKQSKDFADAMEMEGDNNIRVLPNIRRFAAMEFISFIEGSGYTAYIYGDA